MHWYYAGIVAKIAKSAPRVPLDDARAKTREAVFAAAPEGLANSAPRERSQRRERKTISPALLSGVTQRLVHRCAPDPPA